MKQIILECPIGQTTVFNNNWKDCLTEESLRLFLDELSHETRHRYSCRYSVDKEKIAISVDDILINKTELIKRWFKSLPNKFFETPTIVSTKYSNSGSIEHLYSYAEVMRIEQTPEFQAEYNKIRKIQIGQGFYCK